MLALSVIVPVYNTETYINRCINSILNQTLTNLEIIVVNDGSAGNIEEIIKGYQEMDSRVKYVAHESNRGLFQARLTGAQLAAGKYIAFADSDDFVTIDYYRMLTTKMERENADIVVGKTVRIDNHGQAFIQPFHDQQFYFDFNKNFIEAPEIKDLFFGQHGMCYGWHTIWNKVYSKTLWDQCEPYYHYIQQHIVMTEDIAFSLPLLYFANRLSSVQNDGYFYCDNNNASTNTACVSIERYQKNIEDMKAVFDFGQWFLKKVNADIKYQSDFLEFRKHYARLWRNFAEAKYSGIKMQQAKESLEKFVPDYHDLPTPDDHFYGQLTIPWSGGLEHLKEQIKGSSCKYISFDIFDTLVKRPLYNPDDIFYLMQKFFQRLSNTNMNFHKMRRASEDAARFRLYVEGSNFQDVSLEEIYDAMSKEFGISSQVTIALMEEEIRLELELSAPREAAKELFEVAQSCGKEIIVISDMYLKRDSIEAILQKCGYSDYRHLFLSSEVKLTKYHNGELFNHVLVALNVKGNDILHIGDTWISDIANAKSRGFETLFFPKAKEVFEGKIESCSDYNGFYDMQLACGNTVDFERAMGNLGIRTMIGIICNEYFDNPYKTFCSGSKYNVDPYYIGLFPVGIHMVSLVKWITEQSFKQGYDTIAYLARDGFLPMKVHQAAAQYMDNLPKTEYIHVSRKSVMPLMLSENTDFYDMPIEIGNHSCNSLMSTLTFCSKDIPENVPINEWQKMFIEKKFLPDKRFTNFQDYKRFIDIFHEHFYDKEKHKNAIKQAKVYLKSIDHSNLATFDLGYSGRIQAAINTACQNRISALFVHSDEQRSFTLKHKHKFAIHSFYDYTPHMSGLPREHIFSTSQGSCIGYDQSGEPIFEDNNKNHIDARVIKQIHQGALAFCNQFWLLYAKFEDEMDFKPQEASLAFEGFISNFNELDLKIFSASYFEDTVYGGMENINIGEHIKRQIMDIPMLGKVASSTLSHREVLEAYMDHKGRYTKALVYLLIDRGVFVDKLKVHLEKKPWMYRTCRRVYWRARGWR
ncbi:MAG: glycosyltransferase [Defluviitaleaceae bacterium]|nr:glycosyltransferase [Defluviitaleaceae bacterium]